MESENISQEGIQIYMWVFRPSGNYYFVKKVTAKIYDLEGIFLLVEILYKYLKRG